MQYIKIRDAIAEQVSSGALAAGHKLPSERKLAETFATTRVTLREALSLLEADGVIYREERRGWFISHCPLRYDPSFDPDLLEICHKAGRSGAISLISHQHKLADKNATQMLNLLAFSDVLTFDQLLSVDGRPVAKVINTVRDDSLGQVSESILASPLKRILIEQAKESITLESYKISVSSLNDKNASHLRASVGSPVLLIEKRYATENKQKIAYSFEFWRHDAVEVGSSRF
ncbi:GntR family transcriptional regulator [Veronia pacifica]|uniref:HTH gntR-type domain-containing protein n=1 Tax=Veronia pacifica TaxID=1080227 RepID=A0A1C3EB34_9GAMM|nr:GntR family transcriptional regulator [Veronia pacifica]ODA30461.1 hypothetical protein A8L45_20200 [Veronia pacifica]